MAEEIKLINGELAHNCSYNGKPVSCSVTAVRMMMGVWIDVGGAGCFNTAITFRYVVGIAA